MSDSSGTTAPRDEWASTIDETIKDEGGGDYFGLVHMGWGYKLFQSGVRNEELWFPVDKTDKPKTEASRPAALAKLNQAVVKHGLDITGKKIDLCFAMWINTSEMFGRDTSGWKTDAMWWVSKYYDRNLKEVIGPQMHKFGITPHIGLDGITVWAKVSQVNDITGYMRDGFDADGNPTKTPKKVAVIAEVYADEAACRAAAEKAYAGRNVAPSETIDINAEIVQVHTEDPTMSLYEIGSIYGMDVKALAAVLGYTQAQVQEDPKLLKGKDPNLSVEEVAKFYGMSALVIKRLVA